VATPQVQPHHGDRRLVEVEGDPHSRQHLGVTDRFHAGILSLNTAPGEPLTSVANAPA
jgi:hypothetical protein